MMNRKALVPCWVPDLNSCAIVLALLSILTTACTSKKQSKVIWTNGLPTIGSQSSPRAVNLNGDDVLDIVMGAGRNEFQKSEQGILALDGKTGQILWQQASVDQVYGSATFCDVTGDGVPDVFIGGRGPHFKAIDGKNGSVIWEYKYDHQTDPILQYARFNFNNSVLVPDQNGDGIQDLLTVNGGNAKAAPGDERERFPGVLMIFDSKSGNVIAADTMPDGKESYMSPLAFEQKGETDPTIVFGTGGETINGHLYIAHLSDLTKHQLHNARAIAEENGHGFIAPPTAADITGDGILDLIAISHGSTVFALDGRDSHVLWTQRVPGTESSNSLAVGYFNGDATPDFFTFVSKGQWPNSTGSLQVMLDGKSGSIQYTDSIGCTGYSSPVVYDLDNDGTDEVIISVNEFDCSVGFVGKSPTVIENRLIAIDFKKHSVIAIDQAKRMRNVFSTPWIGDLDDDGYLDVVHCQYFHAGDLLNFLGMNIKRIDTPVKIRKPVKWGAYMGSSYNGCFEQDMEGE
ncbi:PQQ-binding-like beta-propeller repeat protein [Chryseolinea sp. T2]|uniref:outer membrane protein assembly factor BamB family protein n=1 Tax=Chryseolinea sp. T2 TaxID=3129255 RepID=UPI0030769CE9